MVTPDTSPPWGFVEWGFTTLSGLILLVTGFVIRVKVNLSDHGKTLKNHSLEIEKIKAEQLLSRESFARTPTREDFRAIQEIIETRFDQLNTRLDRLDTRVDGLHRHVG